MSTLTDIESALEALPWAEQREFLRHLAERLREHPAAIRRLPLVPATGRPITQEEIDDAFDTD